MFAEGGGGNGGGEGLGTGLDPPECEGIGGGGCARSSTGASGVGSVRRRRVPRASGVVVGL